MHRLNEIEEKWVKGWNYHLVPTAVALRSLLIERLGEDFLNEHEARFFAKNVATYDSYVEVYLITENSSFYLRNIGYTEYPRWSLGYHNRQLKWIRVELKDEFLRENLELHFVLQQASPATQAFMKNITESL